MAASTAPESAVSSTTVQVSSLVSGVPGLFPGGATVGGKGQQFLIVNQGPSIHSSGGGIQIVSSNKQEMAEAVKRREILARQPSYCKILNDLKEAETSESEQDLSPEQPKPLAMKGEPLGEVEGPGGGHPQPHSTQTVVINGQQYQIVSPGSHHALGLLSGAAGHHGEPSPPSPSPGPPEAAGGHPGHSPSHYPAGAPAPGERVAHSQHQTVFLPAAHTGQTTQLVTVAGGGVLSNGSGGVQQPAEEQVGQARKREIRLMKNREAARECRNKKKEYIKCLENRVAVLENQNKALIEELKSLKELYTGQKN